MLCQYKDILGKPNQGLHRFRINLFGLNLALVDLLLTLLLSGLTIYQLKLDIIWLLPVFILWWLIGIILHILFCVETPITKLVFEATFS